MKHVPCLEAVVRDHEPHYYLSAIAGMPGSPPQLTCWCPGVMPEFLHEDFA